MSRTSSVLLAIGFFLSGATSLVLEVAWAKELTYSLGNSVHATSTVIAAFMAGLGLGSLAAGRPFFARFAPIRAYAALQLAIGLLGFGSIPLLRATTPLFAWLHQDLDVAPGLFLVLRFLVVFPSMAGPATLMGMSLPLVVEARRQRGLEVAANAGLFYGLNTLGAVTGTFLAGFVLIPTLGLMRTCMAIGVLDFAIGLGLFALHRLASASRGVSEEGAASDPDRGGPAAAEETPRAEAPTATQGPAGARRLLALVVAVAGFLSMAYEVAWFRVLANVLGGTVHAFTSMLGVFLVGVGLGSVLGTALLPRRGSPLTPVVLCLFAIGAGAMSSLALVNALPMAYAELFWSLDGGRSRIGYVLAQAAIAAVVVLPTALVMGAFFPFALRAYERLGAGSRDRRDASEIYGLNTFGGICGSLATGFFLLPRFGLTATLFWAASASALLAVLVLVGPMARAPAGLRLRLAAAGGALVALAALGLPRMDHLELHRGVFFRMQATREASGVDAIRAADLRLLYYREGLQGSVSITSGEDLALHISGKPVATTEFHDRVHLALLGHLPALFAASPRDVAVIGLGSGVALGALTTHPDLESIEVAELEPAVFDVQPWFAAVHGDATSDPRVELIPEDGRIHLSWGEERYDVITSDPISPIIAGAANLYTEDFYRLAAHRLRPGGVFAQWWQMSGVSERTYQDVLATMQSVFPHLLVFVYGIDSVVLGSLEPFAVDWPELERRYAAPRVREDLAFHGFPTPLDLLTLLWADEVLVADWVRDAGPPNTDDAPWLEHRMPIDHYAPRSGPPISRSLARAIGPGRLEAIERAVPGTPRAALVEHLVRHPPTGSALVHETLRRGLEDALRRAGEEALSRDLDAWHAARRSPEREIEEVIALERRFEEAIASGADARAEAALRELAARARLPISYYWSGRLVDRLVAQGREAEALEVLETMRRRTPGRSMIYARGMALARRVGNEALAARHAEELARFEPEPEACQDRERAFVLRVLAYWSEQLLGSGHLEEALASGARALALDPDDVAARVVRGEAFVRLERPEQALLEYREALARSPGRPDLHAKLAAVHASQGHRDRALETLLEAIRTLPDSSLLHLRTGQLLAGAGRDDEALRHYRRALELEPGAARVHAAWGALLRRRGDLEEAARHLEAALAADPENAGTLRQLRDVRARLAGS